MIDTVRSNDSISSSFNTFKLSAINRIAEVIEKKESIAIGVSQPIDEAQANQPIKQEEEKEEQSEKKPKKI